MKLKHLLTKTLLAAALLGVGQSAWAQFSSKTWNVNDAAWTAGTYSSETTIDDMIVKGVTIETRNSISHSDFATPFTKQAIVGGSGSTTNNYFHFKVAGKSKIKVYVIRGSNNSTTTVYISETYKGTSPKLGANINKFEYNYAGDDDADVYIYASDACKFVAFVVEPLTTTAPTFDPVSGEVPAGSNITATSSADATKIYYKWNNSSSAFSGSWDEATATSGVASIPVPSDNTNNYLHAYAEGYVESSQVTQQYTITTADTDAPVFVSSTPANGATDVAVEGTIVLTFNESIATVDDSKFSLTKGTISSVAVDGSDNTKVNVAYTGLPYNTSGITLSVAADAVSDASGNSSAALSDIVFKSYTRTECTITNIQFSNSAYGTISELSEGAGTITVPYMYGTDAPTINESSITIADGATKTIEGNTITVTAEDGTTTGTYTITKSAITPLSVPDNITPSAFADNHSWVYCPEGYISLAPNIDANRARGRNRAYLFIAAAKTLTLTANTDNSVGIEVYRNGVKLDSPTNSKKSADDPNTIDIELDPTAPCMIMIMSKANSKWTGWSSYAVTSAHESVTLDNAGYATFASPYKLDLTNMEASSGTATAYAATVNAASARVNFSPLSQSIPANTGILLAGTANATVTIPIATSSTAVASNDFLVNEAGTTFDAESGYTYFGMKKNEATLTFATFAPGSVAIPANKAYLKVLTSELPAGARLVASFDDDSETTGIADVRAKMEDGRTDFYNLSGQRLETPKKGLYIRNGKKVIVK